MNTPTIMKLLYGSEAPRCSTCYKQLLAPEDARPAQNPTNPLRTIAFCSPCWSKRPQLQRTESNLSIRTPPETADCKYCDRAFAIPPDVCDEDKKNHRFCSITCFNADARIRAEKARGEHDGSKTLKRVQSYKSAGACDCDDYHNSGYCTMTFQMPTKSPPLTPI